MTSLPPRPEFRAYSGVVFDEYASIPSVVRVREVLEVGLKGVSGFSLERRVAVEPYLKDYDASPAIPPSQWGAQFDIRSWGFLCARLSGRSIGAAAIAWNTPNLKMLEGRLDLALLWDIRVHPDAQRQGVGRALFLEVERWARARGVELLKVETQHVNVPACLFYAAQGCRLERIERLAYSELPHETQLLWCKRLTT